MSEQIVLDTQLQACAIFINCVHIALNKNNMIYSGRVNYYNFYRLYKIHR